MSGYVAAIWQCRYFWLSLVKMDLRTRYRRSILGLGWSLLQPIAMTTILCIAFGTILHVDIPHYAPFLFAGLATWNYIQTTALSGCQCFFQGESYIRQHPTPLAVYPLRTALGGTIHFLIALGVTLLLAWCCQGLDQGDSGQKLPAQAEERAAVSGPEIDLAERQPDLAILRNGGQVTSHAHSSRWTWLGLLSLIPTVILLFIFAWSLAILAGFANVHFQDTQHLAEVGFQILFYASGIIYDIDTLKNEAIRQLMNFNPLVSIIGLVREPIVAGHVPTANMYAVACTTILIAASAAVLTLWRLQRRLIFHL